MQRIYLPHTRFGETLEISEFSLYHQITRVMRARVGQEFVFFDGVTRQDVCYEIKSIDAKKVVFLQKEVIVKNTEISFELHLYQALPNKLEKLEYIIQKCCEVGYRSITFFQAERSQILVLGENKKDRLKKIAIEAIEQCGGNSVPEIEFIANFQIFPHSNPAHETSPHPNPLPRGEGTSFNLQPHLLPLGEEWGGGQSRGEEWGGGQSRGEEWGGGQSRGEEWGGAIIGMNTQKKEISLFCHTSGKIAQKLSDVSFEDIQHINVLVGPEGGFSETEVEQFRQAGVQQIYFGTRILRTETVAPLLGFYISQKKEA